LREHGGQQLVERASPAKEDAEGLVEQKRVLVALHEHRVQRPIKIVAGADSGRFDRGQRIEYRTGTNRNAGRAQRAGEVHDVFREATGFLGHDAGFQSLTPKRRSRGVIRGATFVRTGEERRARSPTPPP
jgi:hypothetical protein